MGLSTHVLDTMHGSPAAGMEVALFTTDGIGEDARATLVRRFTLNADGRSDGPLYDNSTLKAGTYRLVFDVAGYFKARGVSCRAEFPEPRGAGFRRRPHRPALPRAPLVTRGAIHLRALTLPGRAPPKVSS
jgi:5-hydroxyisourate hydrolase